MFSQKSITYLDNQNKYQKYRHYARCSSALLSGGEKHASQNISAANSASLLNHGGPGVSESQYLILAKNKIIRGFLSRKDVLHTYFGVTP